MRTCWGLAMGVLLGCGPPLSISVEPEARQLDLLHTSDLHSRVWPFPERISGFEASLGLGEAGRSSEVGGFARLAHVLEQQRQRGAALWLDSGDALEGAEVFGRFGGRLEIELLGHLGLSAMALGNHELSLSGRALAGALRGASFPVLAANARPRPDTALAGLVTASALLDAGGLKVGLVGVANPSSPPQLSASENPWQLELAPDVAAAVQAALDELASRAGLLVVLSHLGLEGDRALIRGTTGVDLVLGGHQHVVTAEPEWQRDCGSAPIHGRGCAARQVPIVHSGAYGKLVTRLELSLRQEPEHGWEVESLAAEQLPLAAPVPERPDVLELLQRLERPGAPLAFVPELLPRQSALGGDSALGNLVADAVQASSGADVVLLNSSGLRADLEPGLLLSSDLELTFPFAEPWRAVWASGRDLRRGLERAARRSAARQCSSVLQVAGLGLRIDCSACRRGEPCVTVERRSAWGRTPLGDEELLRLVLPPYLTMAGADFEAFGSAGNPLTSGVVEALSAWLQRRDPARDSRCAEALPRLATARCHEAFGERACPLDGERARSWCRMLPQLVGARDERVQMLP